MIIKIDDNVREIETKAFIHRNDISEIHIPKSVEKIGDSAFSVYTDMIPSLKRFIVDGENPNFDVIDGVLVTKDRKKLVAFPTAREGSCIIPEGIEIIGRYAFRMAIFVEEIILPKSLKSIEKGAFYYCSKLKNVNLGGTEKIGMESFYYCTQLENVIGGDKLVSIDKKAFMKCEKLNHFNFSDTVEKIGEQAFYGCDAAKYDWGRGIKKIGDKAFVGKNISVALSKEQEKLLREEIFVMNDKRKFAANINFKDRNRQIVLSGKIGDSNIKIIDGEVDFSASDSTKPKKKAVKNPSFNEIKPVLIDEISGRAFQYLYQIRYNAFGVDDIGNMSGLNYAFFSVATVDENGFNKRSLGELNEDIVFELNNDALKIGISLDFISTYWNVGPYVYIYSDGDLLVDLSYYQRAVEWDGKNVGRKVDNIIIPQLWKISYDLKCAVRIKDTNSDEWKFVHEQKEFIKAERDKSERFIGKNGSVSKKPGEMQKHFKNKYKDFIVPDNEESLSNFFEDSFGNIFNFGYAVVYDESKKGNIGSRFRSYLNIYAKDGTKRETVKFKGYPIYVFQREHTYYVVTQQDKNGKTQAKIRLYRFEMGEILNEIL